MRHSTSDALEQQMDALLRSAADFEPQFEAPFDLVERAMQRATRQVAVVRIQRPIVALLWGGAAGAAAASAAAAFLITAPPPSNINPLETRAASVGPFQFKAQVDTAEAEPTLPTTRSVQLRRTPRTVQSEDPAPVRQAAWQTEDVEHTIEHAVRPALRLQFDDTGQPVDVQAGYLETVTVLENPVACGSNADGDGTGDESDETSGEGRSKEADLPSKED